MVDYEYVNIRNDSRNDAIYSRTFDRMATPLSLYDDPAAMEPLYPEANTGELEELAVELIAGAARLSSILQPGTRKAIAELVRPMNSYYSNRIEGHDTHPLDIERALRNDFSQDKRNRDLQKEALAHINVSVGLRNGEFWKGEIEPSGPEFIQRIHRAFYQDLPSDFQENKSVSGEVHTVAPGEYRTRNVTVAKHDAPAYDAIPRFMARFEEFYGRKNPQNRSRTRRVVAIAAAHHRLAWLHPFLDGNGRVMRLYSDACFMVEELDADGIWSISRGLARTHAEYYNHLSTADSVRLNAYDGRGNLSLAGLTGFCRYFISCAIDQVNFMHDALQVPTLEKRMDLYVDRMVSAGRLRTEARYILKSLFLRGSITRSEAEHLTGRSDKTLKRITDDLVAVGLIRIRKEGVTVIFEPKFPIHLSPYILPGLYPESKEYEMF